MVFEELGAGFKNKVMLVAFLLTLVFVFIFVILIYKEQENNFNNVKDEFKLTLHRSIEQTVNTTIDTYAMMAEITLNTTKAKELMKEGKREALYTLLESKWKTWTALDPDFKIMLFHKADGTAFLRMHKPEVYDDYLSDIRPMVKAVHEQKRILTGYETGKFSTVFRLLTPIFYKDEYLGALDFGINPNHFVKKIHEFTGHKGVLFVKKEDLKLFKRDSSFSLNGYLMQSSVSADVDKLLHSLPPSYSFHKSEMLEVDGKYYSVHAYSMNDFEDKEKAQLLFFYDITETVSLQRQFTLILTVTSVLFMILMYFLLNKSFNRLLNTLKQMHKQHTDELEEAQRLTVFNEKFLNTVFDTSRNIIISTMGKEVLFSVNRAFFDFTGYKSIDAFNKEHECLSEIFEEVDDANYLGENKDDVHWIDYIYANQTKTLKVKILKEGVPHTFLVNANKMALDEKERNVISFTDISELIKYQEMIHEKDAILYQQSKMAAMGEMISMIAHQWRQPLSSISAATMGLKLNLELDNFEREAFDTSLENIDAYVQYMSKTIDDFRNFYRPDKSKEAVLLTDIVEASLSIISLSLRNNNIEVICNYQAKEPVLSYSNELIQVVLNLIKNAKDVLLEQKTPEATITLSVVANDDNTQSIIVADNGSGVPEALTEKIFEPYFTTKDKLNGTGLGLYMSKTIIEEHCGGTIRVENHKGANFIVTLPVATLKTAKK